MTQAQTELGARLDSLQEVTYLGDGLYAGFDGYNVVLTASFNSVYLEPKVLAYFNTFLYQHKQILLGASNAKTEENNTDN